SCNLYRDAKHIGHLSPDLSLKATKKVIRDAILYTHFHSKSSGPYVYESFLGQMWVKKYSVYNNLNAGNGFRYSYFKNLPSPPTLPTTPQEEVEDLGPHAFDVLLSL
ncbi:hypothetical protein GIB67_014669, partial [Kingdonia uniflora]